MTSRPLSGPDAMIIDKLLQVVAICRRNRWGTPADIVRCAETYLENPHTLRRALLNERARADALAEELKRLQPSAARTPSRDLPTPRGLDDQHTPTVAEAIPNLVIAPRSRP